MGHSDVEVRNILLAKPLANNVPHTSPAMYEDLNEIATLRFNKDLESISSQTRERVRGMRSEYAAATSGSGVRSGAHEAAIGRTQIEGSLRLVRALFETWVELVKRRNGHISRYDVDFIAKKLEVFARTQKGHLRRAFLSQRMGATVNLLTQEADLKLNAAIATARRDLAIMAQEHELFSQPVVSINKQEASEALTPNKGVDELNATKERRVLGQKQVHTPDGNNIQSASAPLDEKDIWAKILSWGVVGFIESLALGGGIAFMTTGHEVAADVCYVAGAALFLGKFWTWEDARRQQRARKLLLQIGITLLTMVVATFAILWNHSINSASSAPTLTQPPAARTESKGSRQVNPIGSGTSIKSKQKELPETLRPVSAERQKANRKASALSPPRPPARGNGNGGAQLSEADGSIESKPQESSVTVGALTVEGQTISIAERVKIIVANQLQVKLSELKPSDDFEANLGADPSDIYFLMQSLELQFNITIPAADSTKLHTVGETVSYIEKRIEEKQAEARNREVGDKEKAGSTSGQKISIAERVTVIIAHQLDIDPAKIKPSDDFEVDLGASPSNVYFIMQELEQQYDIKIPPADSKRLNTVGETIAYIENKEHAQQ